MFKKRHLRTMVVATASALLLAGCVGTSGDSPTSGDGDTPSTGPQLSAELQDLADRAQAEGEVNIFVSTDVATAEKSQGISEALKTDFGVDLKVNLINGEPDPTYVTKLIEQLNAGQDPAIDVLASVPGILQWMADAGEIKAVDWSALGVSADELSQDLHAVTVAEIARAVIYNTDMLTEDEAPKSFEELLDPKWQGKIVTAGLPDVFSPLAASMGDEEMVDFTTKLLKEQKASMAPNPTAIRAQVVSGEYPIGYGIRIGTKERESGAPIAYAPVQAPVIPRAAIVLEKAANPSAGELVGYWLSTDSGKELAYKYLDWTSHTTAGSDLADMAEAGNGVWSKPLDWWRANTTRLNGLVAPLLAP